MCTATPKPVKRQNRRSVCLDTGTSQEDDANSRFNGKKLTTPAAANLTSTGGETPSPTSGQSSPESVTSISSRLLPGFLSKRTLMDNLKRDMQSTKSPVNSLISPTNTSSSSSTSKVKLKRTLASSKGATNGSTNNHTATNKPNNIKKGDVYPNGRTGVNSSKAAAAAAKHVFDYGGRTVSTKTANHLIHQRSPSGRDSPVSKKLFTGCESSSVNKSIDGVDDCALIKDIVGASSPSCSSSGKHNNIRSNLSTTSSNSMEECPMCFKLMDITVLMNHAAMCQGTSDYISSSSYVDAASSSSKTGFPGHGHTLGSGKESYGGSSNKYGTPNRNKNTTYRTPNSSKNTSYGTPNNSKNTAQSASNNGDNTTSDISDDTTQQCPICHAHVDKYKIGVHVVTCNAVSATMSDDDDNDLPSAFGGGGGGRSTGAFARPGVSSFATVRKSVQATCPICSMTMDAGGINVHVNMCLDRMN